MNVETDGVVQRHLGPNERLLWSGRPAQGIVFRSSDLFMIPFSLLWGGFAFFWEYTVVVSERAPVFFMLWGVPFVAIGLYVIVGRFLLDAKQRANTVYAVTNQRVIILSGLMNAKTKSLSLRTLSDVSLDEKPDGRGSISFGPSMMPGWWAGGMAWPGMPSPAPAFDLIDNPRSVFELIRHAQETRT